MTPLSFLTGEQVQRIHDEMLVCYGGLPGIRDPNAFASAVQRPNDRSSYQPESSLAELAAALAFGLAKNHAFNDANKRTSLAATHVFLNLNGFQIDETSELVVETWIALASDRISEAELAAWICERIVPFEPDED